MAYRKTVNYIYVYSIIDTHTPCAIAAFNYSKLPSMSSNFATHSSMINDFRCSARPGTFANK